MTESTKLNQYLTRREASKFLGVSVTTLTTWHRKRSNTLRVYMHPVTGWPLYKKEDLEKFLREI